MSTDRRAPPWIAGGLAGIGEISVTYPLEALKVQTQVAQAAPGCTAAPVTPVSALRTTLETYGVRGLWRGCTTWCVLLVLSLRPARLTP